MDSLLRHVQRVLVVQSWQIALLTLVIAFAAYLLRHRSAHVRYLLWLVVLAKCVVPPVYTVPLRVLPHERPRHASMATSPLKLKADASKSVQGDTAVLDSAVALPMEPKAIRPIPTSSMPPSQNLLDGATKVGIQDWCILIWAIGFLLYMLGNLLRVVRTNLWLLRHRRPLSPANQMAIDRLLHRYNLKVLPRIWLVDDMAQPFVWGFFRGSIYLPTTFLQIRNADHQRHILAHELSHVLRLDAVVNLSQILAQALFWFHPCVWWANRKMRLEREKCCDEMAIARLRTEAKAYSAALVDTIVQLHGSDRPAPSLAIAGPVKTLEERMRTMLRPGKRFYARPSLIVVLILGLITVVTSPTSILLTAKAGAVAPADIKEGTDDLGHVEYVDHWPRGLVRCISVDLSPDGRHVYAAAFGSGRVKVLERDGTTGYVRDVQTIPLKGAYLSRVSPDGRYVVCSDIVSRSKSYAGTNSVSLFGRDPSTGKLTLLHSVKNGENEIASLDNVVDAAYSPDSQYVYVVARKSAAVTVFRITNDETLSFVQSDSGRDGCFDGARGIAISPRGDYLYVASNQANTLTVLQRNAGTGKIVVRQVLAEGRENVNGLLGVWGVTCSPDGRFVYTSGSGDRNWMEEVEGAICAFARKPDGTLAVVQVIGSNQSEIDVAGGTRLLVSDNGKHVYALNMTANSVLVFQRNPETGKLVHLQILSCNVIGELCQPADLAFSPDEEYLYMAGEGSVLTGIAILKCVTGAETGSAQRLYQAASSGEKERLQSVIKAGTDINVRGERGYTALHWAAKKNDKKAAQLLIDVGADVELRTCEGGWTPLHIAALHSNKQVAECLIAKGADPDAKNHNNDQTALSIAQKVGGIGFAECLIDGGASVSATDDGRSPLHYATIAGDMAFMDMLVRKGANINEAEKKSGWTPLFYAIRLSRKVETIEWLISKGADLNIRDLIGRSPLALANQTQRTDIADLLKKHGAKE